MSHPRLNNVLFGLTITASILLVATDAGDCDDAAIDRCMAVFPVKPVSNSIYYAEEEFDAQCSLLDEYVSCLSSLPVCDDPADTGFLVKTTSSMFDYICKEKKAEFMEATQCFSSNQETIVAAVEFCSQTATFDPGKTLCEIFDQMMSCCVKSIAICCGKKAGALFDGMMRVGIARVESTIDISDCELRSDLDVEILPGLQPMREVVSVLRSHGVRRRRSFFPWK